LTSHPLTDLTGLDAYRSKPLLPGYPTDRRRLFATQDDVHGALMLAVSSVTVSQTLAMYSLDDAALVAQVVANYHAAPGGMPTLVVLDESCYKTNEGTRTAAPLLALRGQPNFRLSVGTSDKGGIQHLKSFVGDGAFLVTGSTNWSKSGESTECNELEVAINAVLAAELTAYIESAYSWQMANCPQP